MRNPRILTWSSARPQNTSWPVGGPAGQVPGPVHPLPARSERAGGEPLGGQPGPAQVAAGQPGPGHVQFPGSPRPGPGTATGPARTPGCWPPARRSGRRRPAERLPRRRRDHDGGLGRPVGVDHRRPGRPARLASQPRQRLPAGPAPSPAHRPSAHGASVGQVAGHGLEIVHPAPAVARPATASAAASPPGITTRPPVPAVTTSSQHRRVEPERGAPPARASPAPSPAADRSPQLVRQPALGDHHALGLPVDPEV